MSYVHYLMSATIEDILKKHVFCSRLRSARNFVYNTETGQKTAFYLPLTNFKKKVTVIRGSFFSLVFIMFIMSEKEITVRQS